MSSSTVDPVLVLLKRLADRKAFAGRLDLLDSLQSRIGVTDHFNFEGRPFDVLVHALVVHLYGDHIVAGHRWSVIAVNVSVVVDFAVDLRYRRTVDRHRKQLNLAL